MIALKCKTLSDNQTPEREKNKLRSTVFVNSSIKSPPTPSASHVVSTNNVPAPSQVSSPISISPNLLFQMASQWGGGSLRLPGSPSIPPNYAASPQQTIGNPPPGFNKPIQQGRPLQIQPHLNINNNSADNFHGLVNSSTLNRTNFSPVVTSSHIQPQRSDLNAQFLLQQQQHQQQQQQHQQQQQQHQQQQHHQQQLQHQQQQHHLQHQMSHPMSQQHPLLMSRSSIQGHLLPQPKMAMDGNTFISHFMSQIPSGVLPKSVPHLTRMPMRPPGLTDHVNSPGAIPHQQGFDVRYAQDNSYNTFNDVQNVLSQPTMMPNLETSSPSGTINPHELIFMTQNMSLVPRENSFQANL